MRILDFVIALLAAATGASIQTNAAAASLPAERGRAVETVRSSAARLAAAGESIVRNADGHVQWCTPDLALELNERTGMWDAVWRGKLDAAVLQIGCTVEVNGQTSVPVRVRSEIQKITDLVGGGTRLTQAWGSAVRIERRITAYEKWPAVVVTGRITNKTQADVSLGTARLVDVSPEKGGWWYAGDVAASPATVFIGGTSELLCEPSAPADEHGQERAYASTGILALRDANHSTALAFGYLAARAARPDLAARFRATEGGTALRAEQRFLERKLRPGESIELDPVYIAAHVDAYELLERYGDAVARISARPVRHGANSLWCSWYAHRMAMTEDLVLANAAVAARHFRPLGLDIIQLDHGWQRGDITGDWTPNERFPHGLKWLSNELKTRYDMKLGVWIAPTDVAETSETFRKHPDWMLKGDDGKPRVNWKWYWKPNPNCYELDATNPDAARWIEELFGGLSAAGVSYFKIDFIAASGGEQFRQFDPYGTRGWSAIRAAMEAIRHGAGEQAWIRYCQPPPLLAVGLADSAYGGGDTLDAGLNGNIDVLRTNARHLAAGYWINDRLYHREVCDMSVRMQAEVEEVRMRLAMMTLAGTSIAFSDEFQYLPASRIHMMQQCLPPGCPTMRPLDLFDRTIPSLWHVHCKNSAEEWDVVGLFNFEKQAQERTVDFARLGLPADAEAAVFEFWEEKFLGIHKQKVALLLPPQTSRILSIRRVSGRPQIIGTDMHVLQGLHEIRGCAWDEKGRAMQVRCRRAKGLTGKLFVYVPAGYSPHLDFPLTNTSARLTHIDKQLWMQELAFDNEIVSMRIPF